MAIATIGIGILAGLLALSGITGIPGVYEEAGTFQRRVNGRGMVFIAVFAAWASGFAVAVGMQSWK